MHQGQLTQALKEWQVAVDALADGETVLLMRKGGIREARPFVLPTSRVLLYPTVEHQRPELLKPSHADRVQAVVSGWHPEVITIRAWAEITDIFSIQDASTVEALLPWHIWNQSFATTRWRWKPRTPLLILCLRVWSLPQMQTISYNDRYGGCRSWINLTEPVDIADAKPVLSEAQYVAQVNQIRHICGRE